MNVSDFDCVELDGELNIWIVENWKVMHLVNKKIVEYDLRDKLRE